MDIMQFLAGGGGGDATGLLTPQQQTDINSNTLQTIGAGLMKAGGPSPYKANMTALSGIGEALQGGLAARRQSQQDALTQTLVKTNTMDKMLPILKLYQDYQISNVPPPPQLVNMMNIIGGLSGSGIPRAPGGTPGAPGAPGADAAGGAGAVGTPGIVSPQDDLINKTARELGINPLRVRMGDPSAIKAIEERIHATDPAISAAENKKEADKLEIAASQKNYQGLQGLARVGHDVNETADMAKSLISDPDFASGTGAGFQQKWKNLLVATGHDPRLGFSQGVFTKITSEMVQAQLNQAKAMAAEMGGSAGRVFQAQIEQIEKSSPSMEGMTPAQNMFLVDQWQRIAKRNIAVGNMAADHMDANGGRLGPSWDKKVSKYIEDNPLYSKNELKEGLSNIGAPQMTQGMTGPPSGVMAGASQVPMPGGSPPADFLSPQSGTLPQPTQMPAGMTAAPVPGRPAQQPTQATPAVAPQVIQRSGPNGTMLYQTKINGVWVPSNKLGVPLGG